MYEDTCTTISTENYTMASGDHIGVVHLSPGVILSHHASPCLTMSHHAWCNCRDAMRNIKVVVTSPRLQRLVEASKSGDLYCTDIPERPKPVFRTSAPGVGTVLASNLALIWVLMTARV